MSIMNVSDENAHMEEATASGGHEVMGEVGIVSGDTNPHYSYA